MPFNIPKHELNYFAGFFDGEGCIMIKNKTEGRPFYTLTITITLTNLKVLQDFERAFGGHVYGPYKYKNHKERWYWMIGSKKGVLFLKAIYPYLRIKDKEAELAIQFQEIVKRQSQDYYDILGRGRVALQEAEYILMKRLKT